MTPIVNREATTRRDSIELLRDPLSFVAHEHLVLPSTIDSSRLLSSPEHREMTGVPIYVAEPGLNLEVSSRTSLESFQQSIGSKIKRPITHRDTTGLVDQCQSQGVVRTGSSHTPAEDGCSKCTDNFHACSHSVDNHTCSEWVDGHNGGIGNDHGGDSDDSDDSDDIHNSDDGTDDGDEADNDVDGDRLSHRRADTVQSWRHTWRKIWRGADGRGAHVVVFKPLVELDKDEALLGRNPRRITQKPTFKTTGSVAVCVSTRGSAGITNVSGRGTGIVIDDHHVMTVAHNVWNRKYGAAISITIKRDRRADPGSADDRCVDTACVHYGWTTAYSKQNDFAILRVSEPFSDKLDRMRYEKASIEAGRVKATIHGFSFDFPLRSGVLSHSQAEAWYVVGRDSMVFHDGDTMEGASGGPVVNEAGAVIALHRGCSKSTSVENNEIIEINKAVAIGYHDNDVEKFINALALGAEQATAALAGWRAQTFEYRTSRLTFIAWE
ncbi:trypsin-like cysteine/serine peptidase domain-containing protein [Nemania sp. FL0916]|nr:trypsin-like cysteine/serine peptidase domain-containing protein [Nemania sp. FL0916]